MTTMTTPPAERHVQTATRSTAARRRLLLVAGATALAVCGTAIGTSLATSPDAPSRPSTGAPQAPERWGGPDVQERGGIAAQQTERWGGPDVQERAGIAALTTRR